VEMQLQRAYEKLGVSSRDELGHLLMCPDSGDDAARAGR
jgi:hypothetical protein